METMLLIGSEDVRAGGNAARQAGHEMSAAATQMEDSLLRHRQFLDDWLQRFSDRLEVFQEKR